MCTSTSTSMEIDRPVPDVVDALSGCRVPFDARGLVERLLAEVPPRFLAGLEAVVLRDEAGLVRGERQRRRSLVRRKGGVILGLYRRGRAGRRARIELFVDRICEGWPSWLLRLPPIRDVVIGSVLFHEVGHHIERCHLPRHGDPERDAERWSRELLQPYLRRRYRYLRPLFQLASRILRRLRPRRSTHRG